MNKNGLLKGILITGGIILLALQAYCFYLYHSKNQIEDEYKVYREQSSVIVEEAYMSGFANGKIYLTHSDDFDVILLQQDIKRRISANKWNKENPDNLVDSAGCPLSDDYDVTVFSYSEHFHAYDCPAYKKYKSETITYKQAKSRGYAPCEICW